MAENGQNLAAGAISQRRLTANERKIQWQNKVREEAELAQKQQKPLYPRKRALIAMLNEVYPNYQPVLQMARHAHLLTEIANNHPDSGQAQLDAVTAHEKVAKYVSPQLKAVDLTSGGEQIQFGFSINLANIS